MKYKAKVWKVDDNINTDLILPITVFYETPEKQARMVFNANRPGWVDQVQPGDILIGGKNFGMGSSRPAARSLKNVGLGCLVAEGLNGLFYRNCINFAFPALECPGVHEAFQEGDVAEVNFDTSEIRNVTRNVTLKGRSTPPRLLELLKAGGIYPLLEKEGLIAAKAKA